MGELFHLDSPLMRVLSRLAELMILNLLALLNGQKKKNFQFIAEFCQRQLQFVIESCKI